ncbi:MAG: alpha/beta hydrolase-fold protein [Gemmatimonadota bacterium]|jgi:poly(3-hydroxybutyrate) depolymerase
MPTRRLHFRTPVLALALALVAAPVAAQLPESPTHARIQSRTYHFDEADMDMGYEVYVPTSYDSATPTPLIVLLHGLGSRPERVIRYESLTDLAEERGYVVVAPMGYNERGWYGSRGIGRASNRGDAANDPDNLGELSEMDVLNVLQIALDEFNIDRDQVFLAGHSMGGGGTLHIAMTHPDVWAGLAAIAPAIYTSPDDLAAITDVPVIVVQGDDDELVDVDVTRRWIAKMGELGISHRYIEVPGGDHSRIITRTPANMRAIFDFFDDIRAE